MPISRKTCRMRSWRIWSSDMEDNASVALLIVIVEELDWLSCEFSYASQITSTGTHGAVLPTHDVPTRRS